jgi:IS66 Orf2 like protein
MWRDAKLKPAAEKNVRSSTPHNPAVHMSRKMWSSTSYDGQGYWLAQKRLSKGKFAWWPEAIEPAKPLEAYEAQLLMAAGDLSRVRAAPMWRRVTARK